jgi:uncharacterized protein YqgQ
MKLEEQIDAKIAQMIRYCACVPESLEDEIREMRNEMTAIYEQHFIEKHVAAVNKNALRHTENNYHDLGFTHGIQHATKAIREASK